MPASLPLFSRALKLVRFGVIAALVQVAASIVVGYLRFSAKTIDELRTAFEYTQYVHGIMLAASAAMLVGVARAIPELRRMRMDTRTIVISAIGLVITVASCVWLWHTLSLIREIQAAVAHGDLDNALAQLETLKHRLSYFSYIACAKDVSYGVGLYFLVRTVQSSAAVNDQIALRDRAGSMGRALMVMVLADLFYQSTYGLGDGAAGTGITAFVAVLLIAGYWIWCHVQLQRFLFDAAWFVNEPHNLPGATVVKLPDSAPRTSLPKMPTPDAPAARPSQAAPVIVVQQPTAPTPRAASTADTPEGDQPRFLR